MSATQKTWVTVASTAEFMVGTALNTFIIKVCTDNMKRGPNLTELIYVFMSSANISMQTAMFVLNVIFRYWPYLSCTKEVFLLLYTVVPGLTCYSFWLMAWLCMHYCTSIVPCSHRYFLRLKRALSLFSFYTLLMAVAWIFPIGVLCIWLYNLNFQGQPSGNCTSDSTVITAIILYAQSPSYAVVNAILGSCPPFIIALISTTVTATSLLRHIQKMKQDISGASGSNLQALTNATRTMILLLTLSVILYVAEVLQYNRGKHKDSDMVDLVSWYVLILYPAAEATIIIQASPKMRKLFLGRFCVRKPNNVERMKI